MLENYSITITDNPDLGDIQFIENGLTAYNLQHAPPDDYQRLVVILRGDDGTLCGGILGNTWWGWLRVDVLWIDEAARGQEWGTRLMEAAEAEAAIDFSSR